MISDIFEQRHEKMRESTPYFAVLIVSIMFTINFVMLSNLRMNSYLPFLILSIFGIIFSFFKIALIEAKNPGLHQLIEEFFVLKNSQNPDFLTLKKQEILFHKIIAIAPPRRYNHHTKEYYTINEIKVGDKIFLIDKEELRIRGEIADFLKNNSHRPEVQLQQQFFEVFEKIIQWKSYKKDEKLLYLADISHIAMIVKSIFQGFIATFLYFTIPVGIFIFYNHENYEEALWAEGIYGWILIVLIIVPMMTLVFWWKKRLKTFNIDASLYENFSILVQATISYLSQIRDFKIHHTDALFFADLINFLWENILERKKRIEKYEKFFYNNYRYFCIQFSVPEEIEKYFNKEKIKLRDDAILVQKIVQKWSEIESFRLEKNSQNTSHPAVLASNKRRELMLRNLQNFSKNL